MWKRFLAVGVGVIGVVVAASAQGASPSQPPAEIAIIGCLERSQSVFMMKDYRSGTRYRLDATAELLSWHVGHELEIHGTVQSGSTGSGAPTMKVASVIYLSQTCSR